jgi:hypothetical protein
MPTYRVYRLGDRPIFAVPNGPHSVRLAGLKCFQPHTFRRSLYRRLMSFTIHARLDSLLGVSTNNPLNTDEFDFDGWVQFVADNIGLDEVIATVVWPPQRDRGRFYVHLFDRNLNHVGFVKVSLDSDNDVLLDREAATLQELSELRLQACRVPQVLASDLFAGHVFLVMEALPMGAVPFSPTGPFPDRCVEEFAGDVTLLEVSKRTSLSWWTNLLSEPVDEALLNEIGRLGPDFQVGVSRAHGDFGLANLSLVAGQLWVFDWETSVHDAPSNVDALAFELDVLCRRLRARAPRERLVVEDRYLTEVDPEIRPEHAFALAYLRMVRRRGFSWRANH